MVLLDDVGKRYQRQWIFQGVSLHIEDKQSYAILGPNGSGKSTLLQIISGILSPSEGRVSYQVDGQDVEADNIYKYLSYSAPYLELIEEFSLIELVNFHRSFKSFIDNVSSKELINRIGLSHAANKQIRHYSSGMKQRVRLGLAMLTESTLVLLDEPTNNLDNEGIEWYRALVQQYMGERLLLIASNQLHEYDFCANQVDIREYKPLMSS